jgi:hypothetical protein
MRRAGPTVGVVLAIATASCTGWRLPWSSPAEPPPTAEALLVAARTEAAHGRERTAIAMYESIAHDYAGQDTAAEALHDLALLRLDPKSPVRDRRAGQALLARLATDYPSTTWGREARLWRLLARDIDRCESEATKLGADAERLRQTLDSLKDSDVELEQHP